MFSLGLYLSKLKKVNTTTLESRKWRTIGTMIGEENVHLETIVWPGGDIIPVSTGRGSRSIFRIVTAFAPPFVMIGELDEDGQCLRGNSSVSSLNNVITVSSSAF